MGTSSSTIANINAEEIMNNINLLLDRFEKFYNSPSFYEIETIEELHKYLWDKHKYVCTREEDYIFQSLKKGLPMFELTDIEKIQLYEFLEDLQIRQLKKELGPIYLYNFCYIHLRFPEKKIIPTYFPLSDLLQKKMNYLFDV